MSRWKHSYTLLLFTSHIQIHVAVQQLCAYTQFTHARGNESIYKLAISIASNRQLSLIASSCFLASFSKKLWHFPVVIVTRLHLSYSLCLSSCLSLFYCFSITLLFVQFFSLSKLVFLYCFNYCLHYQ